jgi:hypothetical protein
MRPVQAIAVATLYLLLYPCIALAQWDADNAWPSANTSAPSSDTSGLTVTESQDSENDSSSKREGTAAARTANTSSPSWDSQSAEWDVQTSEWGSKPNHDQVKTESKKTALWDEQDLEWSGGSSEWGTQPNQVPPKTVKTESDLWDEHNADFGALTSEWGTQSVTDSNQDASQSTTWGEPSGASEAKFYPAQGTCSESDSPQIPSSGFQLIAGFALPISMANAYSMTLKKVSYLAVGTLADIYLGYRWKYGGIYLRQQLGGTIYLADGYSFLIPVVVSESISKEKYDSAFMGSTAIMGKGILPISRSEHLFVTLGMGLAYQGELDGVSKMTMMLTANAGIGYEHLFRNGKSIDIGLEYSLSMLRRKLDDVESYWIFIHSCVPTIHIGYLF